LADATGAVTINKLCGSGLKAVMQAHDGIKAGSFNVAVAGGMESMTNAPYIMPGSRGGYRMGHQDVKDHMFLDGLEDAETGKLMGKFAQEMADEKGYTREKMDAFAIESLNRALTAIKDDHFKDEIEPVTFSTRKGEQTVDTDEQPALANAERIPTLRPAFAKDGTITAANASSISDGAAAVVVMKESQAKAEGLDYQARIIATASNSRHPSEFTIAPIGAIEKVLTNAGWSVADVDLWEINEAFAMVTMAAMDELNIEHSKVNVEGGACALGHPVGCSGARILVTLINSLKRTGGKKGVATLCIGGGEAVAVAIELP
jgi:acetyl-CoA C-acetyltransferase